MATTKFKAGDTTVVSVAGQEFKAVAGFIEVPSTFEKQMLTSGFKLADAPETKPTAPAAAPKAPAKADGF